MYPQCNRGGYTNVEAIVVNDGSTDNTKQIVEELIKNDSRIKLYNQENKGVAAARNAGLKYAGGKYIAWCDSDDWYKEDFLSFMLENLKRYNADMMVCEAIMPGYQENPGDGSVDIWDQDGAIRAFLEHKKLNGVLPCKLIKKHFFDGIEFNEKLRMWEDLDVNWKLLGKINRVVRVNSAKYVYVVNPTSLCNSSITEKRLQADYIVWNKIVDDCKAKGDSEIVKMAELKRMAWVFGSLKLMFKANYYNRPYEKMIQETIREQGVCGINNASGCFEKMFLMMVIISTDLGRAVYRIVEKCRYAKNYKN